LWAVGVNQHKQGEELGPVLFDVQSASAVTAAKRESHVCPLASPVSFTSDPVPRRLGLELVSVLIEK